ncbi:MAG TPA: NADH:flavin oxidoreductase/NADH oxidase [Candidatus Cybelea sp.]|nr:NADH:flavin oxidoreductase/NADH oxidase [Candidatus Cybelea sp.]
MSFTPRSKLFTPIRIRGVTLRNRLVIAPMCQYSAVDGTAGEWHFAHLAKFAVGGAGLVFTEATAVEARGRITHGDLGIWEDRHIAPLARIAAFVKSQGAVPAIQLAHAGRKASMQRPWHGNGPMDSSDTERGEEPWEIVGPSDEPMDTGWLAPHALTVAEIKSVQDSFVAAARRALAAGFEVMEMHGAHGYLVHEFLSPRSNRRKDAYGGELKGRMRFALELAEALRSVWPADKPLFVRVSSIDAVTGIGWRIEDTVALARELKRIGVDVIDCSSGGIEGSATAARVPRGPGFQVPFAAQVRREAGIATQAVGLILQPEQAEAVLQAGDADLVAIGREALYEANWPLHAAMALEGDDAWQLWPAPYGWWLERRAKTMVRNKGG